jgi:acyl-coenzyme A synthetase/AMP-(fatty) acid ligase
MLYPRWLEISRRYAAETAVYDGASGELIRFENLAERAAALPPATEPVIARSGDLEFILQILRAWRDDQPVVPVERDTPDPGLPGEVPQGIVLVKHTPGATGIPRGIHFTADQLIAEAARLVPSMEMSRDRPNLAVISLAHSYGFSNLVLPLLLHGIPMHALPVPFPQAVAAAFAAHDALAVPAVPSIWRAWFRSGILDGAPVACAISAGAPLPLALEQKVHAATGIKIRNFYGASECGGISFDNSAAPRDDPSSVGTSLDGVTLSVDPSGRLLVESDAVGVGYDHSRPGDLLGEGRFLTHDLGRVEDRRVFLDRTSGGAINVAGRKISPAKVESALLATGIPRRVRVFGVPSPDPDRVEKIIGLVEIPDSSDVSSLKQTAAPSLASWEFPRHWWINPPEETWSATLPELRDQYRQGPF